MNDDEKIDAYLIDPAAPPSAEVSGIERSLGALRFDPMAQPLVVRPLRRRPWRMLAAAAAVLAFVAAGVSIWIWTWPSNRSWQVVSGPVESLKVGEQVSVGSDASLVVRVARIGWMRVGGGSAVTLDSTRSNHHRLSVSEGTVHVSIWAPPWSLAVRTPAGEVIDFGCEFILRVEDGVTNVDVVSGWVRAANASGAVLVPGGASSVMTRSGLPSVPLFQSATPEFKAAVRVLEDASAPRDQALATALREARRRDVLTLLLLGQRNPTEREALVVRASQLMPPRSQATLLRARRGDDEALEAWIRELPLPPLNWVPNWRDRLPFGSR